MKFREEPSADTISLKRGGRPFLLEGAIVQASPRTAFMCYQGGGPFRDVTVRDTILRVEPKSIWLGRSYWAVRGYDMVDALFERVEITGFGKVTDRHDEGHAIYLNLAGSFTLLDSDIHHNGGQGLQLVNRPHESVLPAGPAAGTITVRNTRFLENGFNPDRGGFQVSIFGTGQSIEFEDVEILAGTDETVWHQDRTGGGLVIEMEGYNPKRKERRVWWRPAELPEDFVMPFAQGPTRLTRVRVSQRNPNKALVQIKGCEELVVTDSEFNGGRVQLDHPKKPGRNCGRIEWTGNRGDASVWHAGVRLGRADEDFVIE